LSLLVEDILDMARFENGNFKINLEDFSLNSLVEEVIELLK